MYITLIKQHMKKVRLRTVLIALAIVALMVVFALKAPAFNVSNVQTANQKIITLAPNDEVGRKTIMMIIITTAVTGVLGILSSKLIPELPMKCIAVGFIITAIFSSLRTSTAPVSA